MNYPRNYRLIKADRWALDSESRASDRVRWEHPDVWTHCKEVSDKQMSSVYGYQLVNSIVFGHCMRVVCAMVDGKPLTPVLHDGYKVLAGSHRTTAQCLLVECGVLHRPVEFIDVSQLLAKYRRMVEGYGDIHMQSLWDQGDEGKFPDDRALCLKRE